MLPESKVRDEFYTFALPPERDLFEELFALVRFEDVGKGRQGAVFVKVDEAHGIPIVRTTSRYNSPAQRFRSVHDDLAERIQKTASLPVEFNNALIECYTNAYTTMGSHSDQALDLADGSHIALFSCYKHPELANPRKLIVQSKLSDGESSEIPLPHNSVVVFSVDANRRFKHKIVLQSSTRTPENQWLGVTFRTSKTFLKFRDGAPSFPDGVSLTPANDEQRREFYQLRGRENNETDFTYPRITYTISESDLMPPEPG